MSEASRSTTAVMRNRKQAKAGRRSAAMAGGALRRSRLSVPSSPRTVAAR